jgi:thiamine-phosphate diphosphorylase
MVEKLPPLYLITEKTPQKSHQEIVSEAIKGGIKFVQLRDKKISDREFFHLANQIREITQVAKVIFIINDRVEIAAKVGADGVHLGQQDLGVKEARKILGSDKIIGVTCKNFHQAEQAEKEGANYLSFGPIFPSPTKPSAGPILGLDFVPLAKKKFQLPIYGIGGITLERIPACFHAGLDGVAICSALTRHPEIEKMVTLMNHQILISQYKNGKRYNPAPPPGPSHR